MAGNDIYTKPAVHMVNVMNHKPHELLAIIRDCAEAMVEWAGCRPEIIVVTSEQYEKHYKFMGKALAEEGLKIVIDDSGYDPSTDFL